MRSFVCAYPLSPALGAAAPTAMLGIFDIRRLCVPVRRRREHCGVYVRCLWNVRRRVHGRLNTRPEPAAAHTAGLNGLVRRSHMASLEGRLTMVACARHFESADRALDAPSQSSSTEHRPRIRPSSGKDGEGGWEMFGRRAPGSRWLQESVPPLSVGTVFHFLSVGYVIHMALYTSLCVGPH